MEAPFTHVATQPYNHPTMTNAKVKYQETCLVIMTGLLVFWFVYQVKVLVTIAVAIGIIGAFIPSIAKWIHWAWYKLADVMGWVMSKVLLSAIFFLFLFPIALIYRMFSKDTLQLKRKTDSYWTKRSHKYTSKDLEHVW
jgi:hypothetical protein